MRPTYVVEIETPKKYLLNGLWFGLLRPKRVIIWIHGLTSSAFSGSRIIPSLVDSETAVLTFNNRGHDTVTRVSRVMKGGKKETILAGSAHEIFEDCVDDIQGAIDLAKQMGAKQIFLAGHSTGCQKAVFYSAQKIVDRRLTGIILLAPVSDYAGVVKKYGIKKVEAVAAFASSLVKKGKPHQLIPSEMWPEELDDAQRFLSLYTPDSSEEIFCYSQGDKKPATLRKVLVPILVLWAGDDEYADRSSEEVVTWFKDSIIAPHTVQVITRATHTFRGGERKVTSTIKDWLKGLGK